MEEARVLYSGRVQGVGFRYTALKVAGSYAVAGTVGNLPDGRVELIAQGDVREVESFLRELGGRMSAYVTASDIVWRSPAQIFGDFRIVHF